MPNADLDAAFVRQAVCIEGKAKTDYYDTAITGFLLECRATGGKTYALRYRDEHGRQRQHKIGDTKSVSFDKARSAAERLRSRVVLGENPAEEKKVKRAIPTIAELYRDTYLPHLQKTRRNMGSDLSFWKNHLLPRFGSKHLDELKQSDVVDALTTMRAAGYSQRQMQQPTQWGQIGPTRNSHPLSLKTGQNFLHHPPRAISVALVGG